MTWGVGWGVRERSQREGICVFRRCHGKEPACQRRSCGFDPWVGKIFWRRSDNPLQYSCLGSPMGRGVSPWGHKESDMTERPSTHIPMVDSLHCKAETHYCKASVNIFQFKKERHWEKLKEKGQWGSRRSRTHSLSHTHTLTHNTHTHTYCTYDVS